MDGHRESRRASVMEYEQSVVFGQYHEKLASFARLQARKTPRDRFEEIQESSNQKAGCFVKTFRVVAALGNWPLLICLGIVISFLSFAVDVTTHWLIGIRTYMFSLTPPEHTHTIFGIWTVHSVTLVMISACIVRYVSPQSAGAGVAEMKVIIRGVVIKEYLTLRTLIAKIVGVPFVLASGIGVGKEGPFVHISSMVTNLLFKLFSPVTVTPSEHESRFQELITIAAAVGVSATFAAPIGSVLYSIEIVKSFFAVRSYWEGFFAATWGALLWRLFAVWFQLEENISHILITDFRKAFPYETLEILLFAMLGLICGLISHLFVQLQRGIVKFNRRPGNYKDFIQRFPLFYPLVISLFVAVVKFPKGIGMYTSAHMSMEESMHELFSNFTWGSYELNDVIPGFHGHGNFSSPRIEHEIHILHNWSSEHSSIFVNTFLFVASNFFTVVLASTVPIPGGLIVPLFMIGAGFGRFFGEFAAFMFPYGLNPLDNSPEYLGIIPGAYAVAASAAMCGGVTGSLSVAVIAFEITGQLTHFLPIIVCVLCSNLVARYLGPTIYESTIELKNLPFLPTMIKASAISHRVLVEDFMETDVKFLWKDCTFQQINDILNSNAQKLAFYPFVSSPDSKFLLGIVHYLELKHLLDNHLTKSGLKGGSLKDEHGGLANNSPNVTFNGRFQIWSNFGPYKVSYLNKALWEKKLNEPVDFSPCQIDPAPLQIMEGTPLSNIHNLFSLLSLQVVYVTSLGRLTGMVSLKHLRTAIESVEKGIIPINSKDHELEEVRSIRSTDKSIKSVDTIPEEQEPLNSDSNHNE